MKLHFVDQMDEVLKIALESPLPTALPAGVEVLTAVPSGELTANLPAPQ
jgi:hypothetical protein